MRSETGTVATALDLIEAGYAMLAHESFETQTHPELLAVQSRLEAVSWKQPACDVRSPPSSDSADAQLATLRLPLHGRSAMTRTSPGRGFATSPGSGYRASEESCSISRLTSTHIVFSHAGHRCDRRYWPPVHQTLPVGWYAAEIPVDHDSDGTTCG